MSPKQTQRQLVECYTRCCGWFVPKSAGNPGKQAEYKDRKMYKVEDKIK